MKVKVEAECTPAEARAFLGLPDVTPINDKLVEEVKARMEANMALVQPEELMRSWMAFGGQAQESFRKLFTAAATAATRPTTPTSGAPREDR